AEAIGRVLSRGCYTPVERFGVADGWTSAGHIGDGFEVCWKRETLGRVRWSQSGRHNEANALAAIAAARHCGGPPAQAIAGLARCEGGQPGLGMRGGANGITVYDDFAHHPPAIEATLGGLRERVGASRIVSILEPRSNTMKTGMLKDRLAGSLAASDLVYCYSAGLTWDAGAVLAPLGARVVGPGDFEQLLASVAGAARPGDHIVIMSNGGFNGIHEKLLALLAAPAVSGNQ